MIARQVGPSPSPLAAATVADQVAYLASRGMAVHDPDLAERCLTHIGFRRLSSYWQPFEAASTPNSGGGFRDGATFNAVMARYLFDQRLRSLLLESFSYVEVSIKTQWAYQLASTFSYGEFAHQNANLFNQRHHSDNLQELQSNYGRIRHHGAPGFANAAIWDVMPAMSFGQLSKWYFNLNDRAIRQSIARSYGMDEAILRPALYHLAIVRNICAHHERLFDVSISKELRIPKRLSGNAAAAAAFNTALPSKIYNTLVMLSHLLEIITPNGDWAQRLIDFKETDPYRSIPDADLGFPSNWRAFAIWKRHLQQ